MEAPRKLHGLIAKPHRSRGNGAVAIAKPAPHPFRGLLPPITVEPLAEERWTNFTFFCASFVSGFIFFFGMIV